MKETLAAAMPDLTQDFSALWPGLCAPTSAADVLFSIHERDERVLSQFPRGPNAEADKGVTRLVAGGLEQISPKSLAGRMGVGPDGVGATNDGMRQGFESWLDEVAPGAWSTRLDWFEDAAGDRKRNDQREFFGRLATAVDAGGGAILCLWPGTEFSDNPAGPPEGEATEAVAASPDSAPRPPAPPDQARRDGKPSPLPDAAFPQLPPVAQSQDSLPGRSEPVDPAAAVVEAGKKMNDARRKLDRGRAESAFELASEAVSLLHEASRQEPSARPQLAKAIALCRECEAQMPPPRSVDSSKATQYQ